MYKTPRFAKPRYIGATRQRPFNPERHFTFEAGKHATLFLEDSGREVRVKITRVLGDKNFEGLIFELDHDTQPLEGLELGDTVTFEEALIRHIE